MKKKPKEHFRLGGNALSRIPLLTFTLVVIGTLLVACAALAQSSDPIGFNPVPLAQPWLVLIPLVVIVLINALFVATETSIDLLRPSHIRFAEREEKGAKVLQELHENKSKYVAACSLGSQTMRAWMIILSFVPAPNLASEMSRIWGVDYGFALVLGAAVIISVPIAAVNLIFGELVPRSYAVAHPRRVATRLFGFIRIFTLVFALPALIVMGAASIVTKRFGGKATFALPNQAEEEIKDLVETAQETGEIEVEEKELLHSVFEFSDTVAREVMTPRVDMDALPVESDAEAMFVLIEESGHSRIPVYENSDDEIVGIVHAKELLLARIKNGKPLRLRELMRPALFVPENKNLHELLKEMRMSRSQMAVVQDEFGGTAGILTIEDIVEELVGEIVDEYDVEEPEIVLNGDGYIVDGKTNLYDLNNAIGSDLNSEEFDTIAGYVFGLFGRQPKSKDYIDDGGYRFEVEETDGRRILKLYVQRLPEESFEPSESTTA